ncbi:prostaglandin E2 receptor EP4 subtype-like [Gadus chalcogrammus]|uniref:prostaglandin E2 receptor EP4 subtype-like n=1 Tax=Gadus chalcogrammus TaxID=1042646 RepID=UPI0024C4D6A1|nr:prostaglandin E2 receptor EP4 subtype-like [Gadus chalcogrammus]
MREPRSVDVMGVFLSENTNFTDGFIQVNRTQLLPSQEDERKAIALPVLMFAGGALGNIIAIVVLSISRQDRKSSAFYTLVCGLAVTDLLGTCLASPLTIANYLDEHILENGHLCAFQSFLLLFFGVAGLSIICAMSAERYMAICCPYTYRRWRVGRRFAQKFLFSIYVSNVLFCCLPMMGMARSELQTSLTWCFIEWRKQDPLPAAYTFLYGTASLSLILATVVFNVAVCGTLLLMRKKTVQRPSTRASVRERWVALSSAAETQMIVVLVLTSVVVLACSAPLVARVFANQIIHQDYHQADLTAIRIASVNPILDPWIYILLRRSLFKRILRSSRRVRISQNKRSSPPSSQTLFNPGPEPTIGSSHVLTQLLSNSNVITQLPAYIPYDPEAQQQARGDTLENVKTLKG